MLDRYDDVVIMYPDYQGKGLEEGGFADRCLERFDNVCAIVNGADDRYVKRNDLLIVESDELGLGRALIKGYRELAGFEGVVVRMDTEEADLDKVYELVELCREGGVVGDLCFDDGQLRPGSADEHSSLDVFPIMFESFTGGRLSLSGAHGFQAWRGEVVDNVVSLAEKRWVAALNGEGLWGFDASMVMSGLELGVSVGVVKFDAIAFRDRGREKIGEQFRCVLNVLLEYERNGFTR